MRGFFQSPYCRLLSGGAAHGRQLCSTPFSFARFNWQVLDSRQEDSWVVSWMESSAPTDGASVDMICLGYLLAFPFIP